MSWESYPGRGLGRARAVAVWLALAMAGCTPLSAQGATQSAPVASSEQPAQSAVQPNSQAGAAPVSGPAANPGPKPTKKLRRKAESAYFAGAKKLDRGDPAAAQQEFERAAQLDPGNAAYAMAVSVARERRVTALVRQSSEARRNGDEPEAQSLLTQARAIDPDSPLVREHSEPTMSMRAAAARSAVTPAADAAEDSDAERAWRIVPNAAGPVHLAPLPGTQSFDLNGDSTVVIRRVLEAYGIHAVMDDSVEHRNLRFTMGEVTYAQAINALTNMANVFLVPADATTALVAKNDPGNRTRLERQIQETIYVQGLPPDQFNELVLALRGIFDRIVLNAQPTLDAIVVRAPEDLIGPLNQTVQGLMDPPGEVVVEVRLYEVDTSRMLNAGANVPSQFGIFNVDQAAAQLVSQNSALVQQAIAQGLISSTASNFEIAAALIASGLVKSSLLNSTIGVFGGGLTQTGITETGSLGVNLGLNSSDTRTLDDIQLRVRDRETATFREGTRYPVTTSTYTAGLAGAAGALGNLGNTTINGVNVSNLLSQYAGSTATIPLVTYENLGVTLDATPTVQKSGRISLKLKLTLEALTGESVNGIPSLANREFDSLLTVGEGQSALLSSFVSSSEVAAMSGLPGLSELPGFQIPVNRNTQRQSTQLVVVVTPHVVRRRSTLLAGPALRVPPEAAQ